MPGRCGGALGAIFKGIKRGIKNFFNWGYLELLKLMGTEKF
jgi:hypothetical protein